MNQRLKLRVELRLDKTFFYEGLSERVYMLMKTGTCWCGYLHAFFDLAFVQYEILYIFYPWSKGIYEMMSINMLKYCYILLSEVCFHKPQGLKTKFIFSSSI